MPGGTFELLHSCPEDRQPSPAGSTGTSGGLKVNQPNRASEMFKNDPWHASIDGNRGIPFGQDVRDYLMNGPALTRSSRFQSNNQPYIR